jgi:hypothetical protein
MRLQFSQLKSMCPGPKLSKHADYTITRAQLHVLEDLFQCFIEVEQDGSLRVVDGNFVTIITLDGAIARHPATQLGPELEKLL